MISSGLGKGYDYQLSVHEVAGAAGSDGRTVYCVVHVAAAGGNDRLIGRIQRDVIEEAAGQASGDRCPAVHEPPQRTTGATAMCRWRAVAAAFRRGVARRVR